jgi:alpha-L-rhamnosidase
LANALPLLFDITPRQNRDNVIDKLVWQLTRARGTTQLTTGIVGTKYLIDTLALIDRNDLVYELFSRRAYPSWGFMLSCGATTIWERWERMVSNEMNVHSQTTLGAPAVWFYRDLAGIRLDGFDVGQRRSFRVRPYLHAGLKHLRCSSKTPWGIIAIAWKRLASRIELQLEVPANCTCLLELDTSAFAHCVIAESGVRLRPRTMPASEIRKVRQNGRFTAISLGSGAYRFTMRRGKS